ncbi:hypothetical protein DPEC_G00187120 [Dallia pectoralis]|uniref:Uncharacterized protein n=1 Tax=Dallia pectoralis TaxID=75939 RepID=A0ACC2GBE8_DALPE|nr:hypothetical protein DPEC_G00187120 [Dallia pectoralis]
MHPYDIFQMRKKYVDFEIHSSFMKPLSYPTNSTFTVVKLKKMCSGLYLTLLSVSVLTVPIPAQPVPETFTLTVPDGPISSHSGSSVDLLCQVSPVFNIQPFEVRWSWSDLSNKPALLYKDQKIQEALMDQRFRGRVSLTGGLERGNASLRLERVTLEDSGEFVCYIESKTWYDKASVVLTVSVIGSQPVISVAVTGEGGGQVNVTCYSEGWSPQPKVTWRNKVGAEISNGQEVQENIIDSQGLVSVSSSLLYSPSESEWLSCIVSLSDEWKTESRILPSLLSGDSKEKGVKKYQVLLVVLSVSLVIIFISALGFFIVFKRKGYKSKEHTDQSELGQNLAETKTLIEENKEQTPTKQTACVPEENTVKTPVDQTPPDDKLVMEGAGNTEQSSNEQTASDEVYLLGPEYTMKTPVNQKSAESRVDPEGAVNTEQSSNEQTASDEVHLQGPENTEKTPVDQTPPDNKLVIEDKPRRALRVPGKRWVKHENTVKASPEQTAFGVEEMEDKLRCDLKSRRKRGAQSDKQWCGPEIRRMRGAQSENTLEASTEHIASGEVRMDVDPSNSHSASEGEDMEVETAYPAIKAS